MPYDYVWLIWASAFLMPRGVLFVFVPARRCLCRSALNDVREGVSTLGRAVVAGSNAVFGALVEILSHGVCSFGDDSQNPIGPGASYEGTLLRKPEASLRSAWAQNGAA
jgi:hypothetical protein